MLFLIFPEPPGFRESVTKSTLLVHSSDSAQSHQLKFHLPSIIGLLHHIFAFNDSPVNRRSALKSLQKMLLVDAKSENEKLQAYQEIIRNLLLMTKKTDTLGIMLRIYAEDPTMASLFLRLLWKFGEGMPAELNADFRCYCKIVQSHFQLEPSSFLNLLNEILSAEGKIQKTGPDMKLKVEQLTELLFDKRSHCVGQLIDKLVSAEPELISPRSEKQVKKNGKNNLAKRN